MADLAVVALGLDASGMKTGADQANRALTSVEKEIQETEKGIGRLQGKLNESKAAWAEVNKHTAQFGGSVKDAAGALSGLGGPVGQAAGAFQNLQGQLGGLTESFGLVGGAALGAVAGVAALGAAFVNLTLDGSKISDEMGDIAEETGFSLDSIQRFGAAAKLSGENIDSIVRPLRTFQALVKEAIKDPSGDAAHTLYDLGTSAKIASQDMEGAFKKIILSVKDLRETNAGTVATNELFGRSIGAIVRSADQYKLALQGAREELENRYIISTVRALQKGQDLDTGINKLANSWDVFKQNLADTSNEEQATDFLDDLIERMRTLGGLLQSSPGFSGFAPGPFAGSGGRAGRAGQPVRDPSDIPFGPFAPFVGERGPDKPPDKPSRASRGETEAEKAAKKLADEIKKLEEGLAAGRKKAADRLIEDMENLDEAMRKVIVEALDVARNLPVLKETTVDLLHRVGLTGLPANTLPRPPAIGVFNVGEGGPGRQIIPGINIPVSLTPSQLSSNTRKARINDALDDIFEDFVFQITTARSTVGGAFKGLLLGITDTFAAEFALQVQKSLQEAFIRPLASWLESALGEIFGGLSIKGLAKGLGALASLFVGFFADGGTIPSGHWGVAGERGPEIVYAGSQPMHVTPMGGGGSMSVVMNFSISTATGEVTARTQDQIADAAARGIERASRLRGAR